MRTLRAAAGLAIWAAGCGATGLRVELSELRADGDGAQTAVVRVAWANAWRNARNFDAAWVVVKYRAETGSWRHALLQSVGRGLAGQGPAGQAEVVTPEDRVGAFVQCAAECRGAVSWTVELPVDGGSVAGRATEWKAFGVEMVYVPEGAFYVGDVSELALAMNAYYAAGEDGSPAGLFRVESEAEIAVGPKAGALDYRVETPMYQGDRQGPIPADFPKGYRAFYLMKYELKQGQYADFLNHIPEQAANFRAIHGGARYRANRGSIGVEGGRYLARAPDRPANWVSWNDGLAFAAWAGLRPMTEFEFTKASRGPGMPVANDFPWGTASKARLRRQIVAPVDDLATEGEAAEERLSDERREELGASFYWVMDLAGSVWERVVTPAHPVGRAFRGSHGNGRVSGFGSALNADWPKGDEEPGGYGYRGGGYYEHGFDAGAFNPHSPTEWRRFGAWGQGPRSVAYGFRAARTAAGR